MKYVLIIDDNPTLAYFTAKNLVREIADLEVLTVGSCQEALVKAEEFGVSVVIADLNLPDGHGAECIQQLSKRFPGIRAIAVSGQFALPNNEETFFASLRKPYEIDELVDLVKKAFDLEELPGSVRMNSRPAEPVSHSCSGYDRHRIQNRLAGLLAGLRALGADLAHEAEDSSAVRRITAEYVDRLCQITVEVSAMLPSCPVGVRGEHEQREK
jgi:CheY-like chemotaxis protein